MTYTNIYTGKKIIILGAGKTGLSCIRFFLKKGITPVVMDNEINFPFKKLSIFKKVKLYLGPFNQDLLNISDIIIVSPGIALNIPCLINAAKIGIEIISDVEIFCREVHNPIISITGSNGKSTVTKLLEKILKDANLSVQVGGNIGIPVLDLLNKNISKKKIFILELSSFHLETTHSLKSLVSTVLNITEDHMDRYPLGLKQYISVKMKIYKNSDICLVNTEIVKYINNKIKKNQKIIIFGENSNAKYSLKYKNRVYWLQKDNKKIINTSRIKLLGKHNYINTLVALAIADIIGVSRNISLKSIMDFNGLPHRFQLAHKNNNITWINDSKSTNVGSTIQAINCIKTKGTIWLLLGGYGKSANFNLLRPYLKKNLIIYCFGKDKNQLYNLYSEISIKKNNIKESIKDIVLKIKPGDVVLLSPSCASYDQFKNFQERGNYFTYLAKKYC